MSYVESTAYMAWDYQNLKPSGLKKRPKFDSQFSSQYTQITWGIIYASWYLLLSSVFPYTQHNYLADEISS